MTVSVNAGILGICACTFKGDFSTEERNTRKTHGHSSCSDNTKWENYPFSCHFVYTLNNVIPFSVYACKI